jgi:hypothetical protein
MHVLSSVPGSPDDEFWPIVQLHLANLPEGFPPFEIKELLNIYHTDPRLQGYRVKLLYSERSPTDPPDCAVMTDDATGQQWRLWRLWVRYEPLPLVGELQDTPGRGWMEVIYHPTWWAGQASPEDYEKLARGLFYIRQIIRRPGHPEGSGKSFESSEVFERKLREALAIVRRRSSSGKVSKRDVAKQMGIAPSTLYAYLKAYPGVWSRA